MPTQNRVYDNGVNSQSLAADGVVSLHSKHSTLVVMSSSRFLPSFFSRLDLAFCKLNDLLLAIIDYAARGPRENVPWLKQKGHVSA